MGDVVDIGRSYAASHIVATGCRIIEIVAGGDIMERGKLLLRVEQIIKDRIGIAYGRLAL